MAINYKESRTIKLKATGTLDLDNGILVTDEGSIAIKRLLADFDGEDIDFVVSVKSDVDLDIPEDVNV